MRRPRRERSVTESLLSVALGVEAALIFFVAITANGLRVLPTPVALGGGALAIVVLVAATGTLRWRWGVGIGWVLQVLLLLTGLLLPVMWGIGALFVGIWVWCFVAARRIETRKRDYAAGLAGEEPTTEPSGVDPSDADPTTAAPTSTEPTTADPNTPDPKTPETDDKETP